mmetsp:Transcript_24854/g.78606  ORF Transcript_24854/g.78606 Transcript_24854/m.78606 type:complete len:232 (-) Transcript_24854:1820-2515(-)
MGRTTRSRAATPAAEGAAGALLAEASSEARAVLGAVALAASLAAASLLAILGNVSGTETRLVPMEGKRHMFLVLSRTRLAAHHSPLQGGVQGVLCSPCSRLFCLLLRPPAHDRFCRGPCRSEYRMLHLPRLCPRTCLRAMLRRRLSCGFRNVPALPFNVHAFQWPRGHGEIRRHTHPTRRAFHGAPLVEVILLLVVIAGTHPEGGAGSATGRVLVEPIVAVIVVVAIARGA